MTAENYRGFMENLHYIKQMYYAYRMRLSGFRHSYAKKMEIYEKSSIVLRIVAELDNKLYNYQLATHILENCSIKLYRESRKAYVKTFDLLATTNSTGIKGIKDLDMRGTYTSSLRVQAAREVPSRYTKKVVPSVPKEEYTDASSTGIFYPVMYDRD